MNQSDSTHGCFPDDVINQILARLPVKSLFRFKCVCKLWCRLASDDYFKKLYNQLAFRNPMVLIETTESSAVSRSSLICIDKVWGGSEFPLHFIPDRVKIRASCNGLLCCSSIPQKGVYYVCNPMTREYRLLPRSRERPISRFYPDGEATLVGLACDLVEQRFHVVLAGYHRVFGHRPEKSFICLIYDSESNKWRKFVTFQDDHFTHMNKNQVVFLNGALHWLTQSCTSVLVLDLKYDLWRKIWLPHEMKVLVGSRVYLLELEGCLSVIQIFDSWMNIWVMENYDLEVWKSVDKVSLRCVGWMVPGVFPISQTSEYVFLATHKQVLVYQRQTKVWKELYSINNNSSLPLWFSAHAFRSTIFSCH